MDELNALIREGIPLLTRAREGWFNLASFLHRDPRAFDLHLRAFVFRDSILVPYTQPRATQRAFDPAELVRAEAVLKKASMIKLAHSSFAVAVLSSTLALAACGGSSAGGEGASGASDAAHPLIGSPGPDFAQPSLNGKGKIAFKSLSGKVAIVDFWATWCEPCKKSFPKLQELNVKYKASGLEIVAISEDDENQGIPEFGTTYGAKFPLLWDDGKAIAGKWQPKSMPATFIVDRKGVVRFVHLGYHDGEEAEIEKEVKSLL